MKNKVFDGKESDDSIHYKRSEDIQRPVAASSKRLPPLYPRHNQLPGYQFSNTDTTINKCPLPPLKPDNSKIPERTWLIWSIISLIFFLPLFMFWIPALIFSLIARKKFHSKDLKSYENFSKKSLAFNIMCLVCGTLSYVLVLTLCLSLIRSPELQRTQTETICVDQCFSYCRIEKSAYFYNGNTYSEYWTCYNSFIDYVKFQNEVRYLYCVQKFVENVGKHVCSNQKDR